MWDSVEAFKCREQRKPGGTRHRVSSSSEINQRMWLKPQVTGKGSDNLQLSWMVCQIQCAMRQFFLCEIQLISKENPFYFNYSKLILGLIIVLIKELHNGLSIMCVSMLIPQQVQSIFN